MKRIVEMFDDFMQNQLSDDKKLKLRKEIEDTVKRKEFSVKNKPALVGFKDDFANHADDLSNKFSKLYQYEEDLKKNIPFLSQFRTIKKYEKGDFYHLIYHFRKEIANIDILEIKFIIMSNKSKPSEIHYSFEPRIRGNNNVLTNDELIEKLIKYRNYIKNKFNTDKLLKSVEDTISDIVESDYSYTYDDSCIVDYLYVGDNTEKTNEYQIQKRISNNLTLFSKYVKILYGVDLF